MNARPAGASEQPNRVIKRLFPQSRTEPGSLGPVLGRCFLLTGCACSLAHDPEGLNSPACHFRPGYFFQCFFFPEPSSVRVCLPACLKTKPPTACPLRDVDDEDERCGAGRENESVWRRAALTRLFLLGIQSRRSQRDTRSFQLTSLFFFFFIQCMKR